MDQLFENVAAVTVPVPDSVKVINVEPDYFDAFNAAEADLDPVTVGESLCQDADVAVLSTLAQDGQVYNDSFLPCRTQPTTCT